MDKSDARRFSVDAEMDRLFGRGRTAGPVAPHAVAPMPMLKTAPARGPRSLRAIGASAIAAALVVGVAGSQWVSSGRAVETTDAASIDRSAPARPRATTIASPAEIASVTDDDSWDAEITPDAADADPAVRAAADLDGMAERPSTVDTRPVYAVAASVEPMPRRVAADLPSPRAVQQVAVVARTPADCGGLSPDANDRCVYAAVLDADRRLLNAYDDAVEAGVALAELRFYRRHWTDARREADRDPEYTIDAYGKLAHDLRLLASRAQSSQLASRWR